MNTVLRYSISLLIGATVLFSATSLHARSWGVSSASYGRGTMYSTARGGEAYVGPRGVAGETANGRHGAATDRGAVVGGPNAAAATGRYGSAVATQNGAAVTGRYGAAYTGQAGAAVVSHAAYVRTIPAGSPVVAHAGYNCYYTGGLYYRPVIYAGETTYVLVD